MELEQINDIANHLNENSKIVIGIERTPHKYSCGTESDRVSKINIQITLPEELVLQGHDNIDSDFEEAVRDVLLDNLYGEHEASLDEQEEE